MKYALDTKRRSPNKSSRGGMKPDIVVLHYTGPGTLEGVVSWLCNPKSKVSCHDIVGKPPAPGKPYIIPHIVPRAEAAWHAGTARLDVNRDGNITEAERRINSRSFGIEIVNRGDGKDPWPDKQIRAVAWLIRGYRRRYGINIENVVDHEYVNLLGKVDLKSDFPAAKLMFYVRYGTWVPRPVGAFWCRLSPAYRRAARRIKYGR